MTESAPVPGWYPSDNQLRWWDGHQWTEHTQPMPAQNVPTPAAGPAADVPAGTIWHAVGKPLTGIGAGRYRLTEQYLFFEKGTLRTTAEQIPVESIVDVDVDQSISQKARGIGTLTVHYQLGGGRGTSSVELEDIPDFRDGVQAINDAAHTRREQLQARANTQTLRYQGGGYPAPAAPTVPSAPAAPSAPTPSASDEIFAQLERLGQLRDAGVLSGEEFDAKKAELLRRL
ncbi:DUF2510 domain-containing protein [Cellulomonas sp. NPDC089187]|uniref:PH domain-containing protein n=1 Tax=Cellulomonas sp. NPDC089187 TaxID=3154970 RepID=UPI003417286E